MTDGLSEAYEGKQWDVFFENNDLLLENDLLKDENAKLREQYETVLADYRSEVAKLRELMTDLFEYATDTALNAINGPEQTKRFIREGADLAHRARALGCEVFDHERD